MEVAHVSHVLPDGRVLPGDLSSQTGDGLTAALGGAERRPQDRDNPSDHRPGHAELLRLTELVARDLLLHGTRPRQAWRYAAELSQREAAGRFNQLTGNPRAPMTGNRIGDYEQWPDGGVRPTVATLKILADAYGTTWDQLVDARDLAHMPGSDRLEYLESSHVSARSPAEVARPHQPRPRRGREDVIADVADESLEFGEWAGMSEVADATIGQYEQQAR